MDLKRTLSRREIVSLLICNAAFLVAVLALSAAFHVSAFLIVVTVILVEIAIGRWARARRERG